MESPENIMHICQLSINQKRGFIHTSSRIDCMLIGSSSLYLLNENVNQKTSLLHRHIFIRLTVSFISFSQRRSPTSTIQCSSAELRTSSVQQSRRIMFNQRFCGFTTISFPLTYQAAEFCNQVQSHVLKCRNVKLCQSNEKQKGKILQKC